MYEEQATSIVQNHDGSGDNIGGSKIQRPACPVVDTATCGEEIDQSTLSEPLIIDSQWEDSGED